MKVTLFLTKIDLIHSKLPPDLVSNLSPLTKASLQAWSAFSNELKSHDNLKEARIALKALELLYPSLALDNWSKHGLMYISDLYNSNTILSFEDICRKFSLPKTEMFNYRI